jgi:hypothetical protein
MIPFGTASGISFAFSFNPSSHTKKNKFKYKLGLNRDNPVEILRPRKADSLALLRIEDAW